jgi:hypothetical protein
MDNPSSIESSGPELAQTMEVSSNKLTQDIDEGIDI